MANLTLTVSTSRPLKDAEVYITSIAMSEFGSWGAARTPYKCRLGWPGRTRSLEDQYKPRRIVGREEVLFLDYEEETGKLFLHSDANYTGFAEFAYHPVSRRPERPGLGPGTYHLTIAVESESGSEAEEGFLMVWMGDPDHLLLMKAEAPWSPASST